MPTTTLEERKAALITAIESCDAMKSDKRYVIRCLKAADYDNLKWFFWDTFAWGANPRRLNSANTIRHLLPPNMRALVDDPSPI